GTLCPVVLLGNYPTHVGGNALSDVKKQNALYVCRNCLVPKDRLTDTTFNRIHYAYFHHITKEYFIELQTLISQNATKLEVNNFTRRYGLRSKQGILSTLSRDCHLQTPHDAYHLVASKVQRLLECTLNLLNDNGKNQFLRHWRDFEKPSTWHRLPNPITHFKSFMFSDTLQLAILIPFILRQFLTPGCMTLNDLTMLCDRLSCSNDRRRNTK
ncbi:30835_t:CDS:2, partial [Racocetra persica]